MKKWIVIVCSLIFLFFVGVYILIPDKIVVARSIIANANQAGVLRFLNEDTNWVKWWPGASSTTDNLNTALESGDFRFKKTNTLYSSFEVAIEKDKAVEKSILFFLSLSTDSVKIAWSADIPTSANPFNKISRYFMAKDLGNRLEVMLAAMQKYISNVQHIYGIDIRKEKMPIEFMVSIKKPFDHYPSTEDIYAEMSQIKKHITGVGAVENNYPVLNISARDSTHFELVVATPVDRQVSDSGIFTDRRMLKNGNLLTAEITGGKKTVDAAMKKMEIYATDHQYLNVAIPYQQFLTDRTKETDTSKWVTRIGFPIL